ncbi:hypothetical protein ACOSP7_006568 [Xanthoceras sorbifolium]
MTSSTYNKPHKTKQPQQLNQLNQTQTRQLFPHTNKAAADKAPTPQDPQTPPPPPQLAQLHQIAEGPFHPTAIKTDRCSAKIAHYSSSRPPDPKTPAPPLTARGGTSSSTAPQLCPEHNPHRRGKEGEIEEGKSKPPYAESPLISKNKGRARRRRGFLDKKLSSQRRNLYPKEGCFHALVASEKEREEKMF